MSSPLHHPADELLLDFHRGALPAGMALAVRTHADTCACCRRELSLFDMVGAALMDEIEGVAMSDTALDLALARIERPDAQDLPQTAVQRPSFLEGFALPESLTSAIIRDRYWAAPGVWLAPVDVGDAPKGSKTYLMHVKAGMVMPKHTHRGMEITVMLRGSYKDHKGTYGPGDFVVCDDEDQFHSPAMGADEDCLCLVFQDASIVPQSLIARLLQPFARI